METALIAVTMNIEIQTVTEEGTAIGMAVITIHLKDRDVRAMRDGNKFKVGDNEK